MEATLISICILFSIIILSIIVYAILDYKYEKRAAPAALFWGITARQGRHHTQQHQASIHAHQDSVQARACRFFSALRDQ